jgi:hypothetical protein
MAAVTIKTRNDFSRMENPSEEVKVRIGLTNGDFREALFAAPIIADRKPRMQAAT